MNHDSPSPHKDLTTSTFESRILRAMRRLIRSVDLHSKSLLNAYQVTAPQLVCLVEIVDQNTHTVSSLSEAVNLSASTVVGILDRLESKGLIARNRDKKDRRVVWITPTESGKALAYSGASPLQNSLAGALRSLPELEQATIALSLERIVELMEIGHVDGSPLPAVDPVQLARPVLDEGANRQEE